MRASLTALLIAGLVSSAAFAAANTPLPQGTPPAVLNPPASIPSNSMSLDNRLPDDGSLHNDAQTMKAIEGAPPADPAAARVEAAKDNFLRANNQLSTDIRNKASKETIKKDREAVNEAKKHLSLDETACSAEAKANGTALPGCK